jgi:hypothetical protein
MTAALLDALREQLEDEEASAVLLLLQRSAPAPEREPASAELLEELGEDAVTPTSLDRWFLAAARGLDARRIDMSV